MDRRRIDELLGGAALAWLVDRLAVRAARGDTLDGTAVLHNPTPEQREAVDRLLGRMSRGVTLSVSLPELERLLVAAGVCRNLLEVVEALSGERLRTLRSQANAAESWSTAMTDCRALCAGDELLARWFDGISSSGTLARLSNRDPAMATRIVADLVRLRERLPARGIPLPELAVAITGDAHELDAGTARGALALHLVRVLTAVESPSDAAGRRDAWTSVGVLCDDLSSSVLVWGLRADEGSLIGRALATYTSNGEPCRLLLRHILREPITFCAGPVYICENPAVMARAAQELGGHSAPLICVEGQPTTAARLLLERLTVSGCRLLYHGDFDWAGIHIANLLRARHGVQPWRMSAADYLSAPKGRALVGAPVSATWDSELSDAMRDDGRAVHEELVVAPLLEDLKSASP